MNDTNGLWEDLVPHQLNLTLNLNQGFALFRQSQTLIAQALQKNFSGIWLIFGCILRIKGFLYLRSFYLLRALIS